MQHQIGMTFFGDHLGTYRRMVPEYPFSDGKIRFDDSSLANDDWLVFTLVNTESFSTHVPRERRIYIVSEPSPMNAIPAEFVNQFGILISPYHIGGYNGKWFPSHPGLPWFFGVQHDSGNVMPFNEIAEMEPPTKVPEISVVVSNKVFHDGHRVRLRFLDRLRERLGDRLQVFGRGIREIDDKADALLPYAYHLSLENNIEPFYWTEKLSDAFLGFSFPIYVGCPNATEFFSADSFKRLELNDFETAAAEIERFLDEDNYEDHFEPICRARRTVLYDETVFNVVRRAVETHPSTVERLPRADVIRPLPKKNLLTRLSRESRRLFHRATFRAAR